jgi:imidazolonepropionase-like amidohydrolase
VERIEADLLVPGRGEPLRNGCVILDDGGSIAYAGPRDGAPATPNAVLYRAATVLPGLWDAHLHFTGVRTPDIAATLAEPQATLAARATADAASLLMAGYTSVREVGGLGVHLARAVDEGTVPGPTIYGAGAVLSTTGGHGDVHALPLDWIASSDHHLGVLCDGVPECLRAVRRQLRAGAKVIKVCASGGVMSEIDHPIHQQFSDEELRAVVEEAARADRVVAAHCHGKPGIMAALRAGVRTIEHGTYLDEEAARLMAAEDVVLVPTRFIVERLLAMEATMPVYAFRKLVAIADRHRESVAVALAAGVRVAAGSDAFVSGEMYRAVGAEIGYLVDAGLTPLQAIEAATANGPDTLGPQAPRSGQLAAGYDGDVIALDGDPVQDIDLLADPDAVTAVWKGGRRVKG